MAQGKRSRLASTGWFSEIGKYVALVLVAVVTVVLVVASLNRPSPEPSGPTTPRVPAPSVPSTTPTPTPTPTPSPEAASTAVAFLGDSYTAGDGATAPERRWTSLLSSANGWTELNNGVAETGYGTAGPARGAGAYKDRVADIVASTPDIVVVSGGGFDYAGGSSPSEVSIAIADTFTQLRAGLPNARILATSVLWTTDSDTARLREISADIRAAVVAVDGYYLEIGQPLAADGGLVAGDGTNPTDAGYVAVFEAISAALAPVLASE